MWVFAILIAAATIYFGAHDVALAQATTPNVTPPFQGLSTPITSTVTNCMMSCNSQVAPADDKRLARLNLIRHPAPSFTMKQASVSSTRYMPVETDGRAVLSSNLGG
jgi:hypothetical protein